MSPTAIIWLTKGIRQCVRRIGAENITLYGLGRHTYANNLGFSEALKIVGNPFPQRAFGGHNYIPLSAMRLEDIERDAMLKADHLGDAITRECVEISHVVSRRLSEELDFIVARSFTEIFRNVFEHSGVKVAGYSAQYWPGPQIVEICISDRGMGVHSSLAENKYLESQDERESLYLALMPGLSAKAWRHKKKKSNQKSPWDNFGFGLYFAHRLFGKLGHFFMASGTRAVLIENGAGARDLQCSIEGTIVSLRLDLSDEQRINKCLGQISEEAHDVKQKIGTRSVDFASVEAYLQKDF